MLAIKQNASKPSVFLNAPLELVIEHAQNGEDAAFKEIYNRYCRVVYTMAFQMVGNHTDTDEIVQETFIRVFKNLGRLRNTTSFTSWLYQITINLSIDHRKMRTRRRMLPLDDHPDDFNQYEMATSRKVRNPGQVFENDELLDQINEAIDELPSQQKAVILMHEVEGLSKKMISEVLNCSLVTVRTNLHHARKKLRKHLSKYIQE